MCKDNKAIESMFSCAEGKEVYDRILATVESENMSDMIDRGVLVGFSGGADSVLLLCFLHEYKRRCNKDFRILAVHVNHGIRGDEAKRDETFSLSFASNLGIEATSLYSDVPALSTELGIGLEEAARNVRYSSFRNIIKGRDDISTIAVAHNATDNAETVIMNILRGSGLSGASGIKPVRDNIVRPLIKIAKRDIVSLLEKSAIPYVTDSTNASVDYSRNYVRNEILPLFERLSQDPEASFTKLTDNLREDLEYLNFRADAFIRENGSDKIKNTLLRELHPSIFARVISTLAFRSCGEYPEEKHIKAIYRLLDSDNFRYSLPGKCDLICERGICSFLDKSIKNTLDGQIFSLTRGENKIYGTNLTVYVGEVEKSSLNVYNFSIQAEISSDIIGDSLFLRFKTDGDSYKYHGMTHKLKKVFNDRNIPASQRDLIPVVCDSEGILVVPGMSVRDGAKSDTSINNTPITFAYGFPKDCEVEVFTALLRK